MNYFFDRCFEKKRMKKLLVWVFRTKGEYETLKLVELLKKLGFQYSTLSGLSIGLDDLKLQIEKPQTMVLSEQKSRDIEFNNQLANLTNFEKLQQTISIWLQTNEFIKEKSIQNFQISQKLNPLYLMAFSGARGNISQVRQLVGMRGLMSDPQGHILDFPIRSNFREGLTLTEYIISCYGARKGIVDTALRTATSGYLTRRLVDVAQHVIIEQEDCGTKQPIWMGHFSNQIKRLVPIKTRILGRVLAKTIILKNTNTNFPINTAITPKMSTLLASRLNKVPIRSPLTCQTLNSVCQLCYGWNLSSEYIVSLGEAVGVLAAQSIGEPGTQLTMRTFHTGGVFSGDVVDQIYAPINGVVYFKFLIVGHIIRTTLGQIGYLTKQNSSLAIVNSNETQSLSIPTHSILFVKHNELIKKDQLIAQFDISSNLKSTGQKTYVEQDLAINHDGQIFFENITVLEKRKRNIVLRQYTQSIGTIWFTKILQFEFVKQSKIIPQYLDLIKDNLLIQQFELMIKNEHKFQRFEYLSSTLKEQKVYKASNASFLAFVFSYDYSSIIFYNDFYFFINSHYKYVNKHFLGLLKIRLVNLIGGIDNLQLKQQIEFNNQYIYIINIIKRTRSLKTILHPQLIFSRYSNSRTYSRPLKLSKIKNYFFWQSLKSERNVLKDPNWILKNRNIKEVTKQLNRLIYALNNRRRRSSKTKNFNLYTHYSINLFNLVSKNNQYKLLIAAHIGSSNATFIVSRLDDTPNLYGHLAHLNYSSNFINLKKILYNVVKKSRKVNRNLQKLNYFKNLILPQWICFIDTKNLKLHVNENRTSITNFIKSNNFTNSYDTINFISNYQIYLNQKKIDKKIFNLQKLEFFYWTKLITLINISINWKNSDKRITLKREQINTLSTCRSFIKKYILNTNDSEKKYTKIGHTDKFFIKHFKTGLQISSAKPIHNFYENRINAHYYKFDKFKRLWPYIFNYPVLFKKKDIQITNNRNKKYNQIHFVQFLNLKLPDEYSLISQTQNIQYKILAKERGTNQQEFYIYWYLKLSKIGCILSIQQTANSQLLNILNYSEFTTFGTSSYKPKLGHFIRFTDIEGQLLDTQGRIYAKTFTEFIIRKSQPQLLTTNGILHTPHRAIVQKDTRFFTVFYTYYKTGDIVQGIPKIEEFFEARHPFDDEFGSTNLQTRLETIYQKYRLQYKHKRAVQKSILHIQQIVINGIQLIYTQQGIFITDKHLEIIVRQMTGKVRILHSGSTGLLLGELVDIKWVEFINSKLKTNYIDYEPIILGITRTCLETNSFISASSFQETVRILTKSAVQHKMDFLCGLKENVILGHLIPAGTGSITL